MLTESISTGKGQRAKNLKVYLRFFSSNFSTFEIESRKSIPGGRENEFEIPIEGYKLCFDEWPWGILAYHALDEDGTGKIESYLNNHRALRVPWVSKLKFEQLRNSLVKEGGNVVNQRSWFEPYNDYSGYGLSVQIRGSKTKEIMDEIEEDYAVHPLRIGLEVNMGDDYVKFEMTNKGRLSFSRGSVESIILIVGKYVNFVKKCDEDYNFRQSRKIEKDGIMVRETHEMISLKMPSLKKIRGDSESRNDAIIRMLTNDDGTEGYIGIPIGPDRANILDLTERKMLQVTIVGDEIYVFSENPSQVQSAIRRLVSKVAAHIDPDVKVERLAIGES